MASGANPSIAYRPLNQSGIGPDNDEEDYDRKWKFSIRLIALWRLFVTGLAFADIMVWAALGLLHDFIAPFVLLFLVITWSLLLAIPWSRFARALPTILCQIGDWTCLLNGEDRPGGPFRKPGSPAQKRMKLALIAAVDLALGLTTIISTAAAWNRTWYYTQLRYQPVLPLNLVVGIMEIIAALTCLAACVWSHPVFEFGLVLRHIDDPDSHTRVQLAPDADE